MTTTTSDIENMDDTGQILQANRNFKTSILKITEQFIDLRKHFVQECPNLSIDPQQTDRTTERFESFNEELIKQYTRNQQAAITICGPNSSGKTAFIQHFLRIGEIFPSDVGPVTTRIVKLTYSPANRAYVHVFSVLKDRLVNKQPKVVLPLHELFLDEESTDWEIISGKLKEHLARPDDLEDGNHFSEWSKHFIEIGIPSPVLQLGIDIYDTPGFLSNGRDEILNQNLYELIKSIQPTLLFLYENPAVSETDQICFLSLKQALGALENIPIFFLNTKADVLTILKNERVNTKKEVSMEKFEKVLHATRQKRYNYLLEHDVIANEMIGGLPVTIDECDCFDICTVPKEGTPFRQFAPVMNERTFRRIILFAVRSDGNAYQALTDKILSSIDEYFDLVLSATYRMEGQWTQLRDEAIRWAERFFEKIKETLPTIIDTIQENILTLFDKQKESIALRAGSRTRTEDRLGMRLATTSNKVRDFVHIAVYEEVMKVAASESMKASLDKIDQIANDGLLNNKKKNELLSMAKRHIQFWQISGEDLNRKKFFATILEHLVKVPAKISRLVTTLRTRPYLDWYNENTTQFELMDALDNSANLTNEIKRQEFARVSLVKMRQTIIEQKPLFQRNLSEWVETKQMQFLARIEIGYQYAINHMQQRKQAHQLTEKYTDRFAMFECQLIAAKNLAKFNGITPIIFEQQLLGAGGFFNVYAAQWGDQQNLAVKKQRSNTTDQHPYAAYVEAHYHRAITNTRQANIVPLSYLYYYRGELCIFMPKYKQSLQTYLQENIRTIKIDQICSFALILANILHDIHLNDLVHRDIKSSNILLDQNDQCYLSDFGTVKEGSMSDTVIGTLPLPSEVMMNAVMQQHNVSAVYDGKAVDVFAYGILLYELLPKKEYFRPNMDSVYQPEKLFDNDQLYPLSADMNDYKQLVLDCLQQSPVNRPTALMISKRIEALIQKNEVKRCAICLERYRTIRTLPCGHKVLCQSCRDDLRHRNYDLCIICKRIMQKDIHDDNSVDSHGSNVFNNTNSFHSKHLLFFGPLILFLILLISGIIVFFLVQQKDQKNSTRNVEFDDQFPDENFLPLLCEFTISTNHIRNSFARHELKYGLHRSSIFRIYYSNNHRSIKPGDNLTRQDVINPPKIHLNYKFLSKFLTRSFVLILIDPESFPSFRKSIVIHWIRYYSSSLENEEDICSYKYMDLMPGKDAERIILLYATNSSHMMIQAKTRCHFIDDWFPLDEYINFAKLKLIASTYFLMVYVDLSDD